MSEDQVTHTPTPWSYREIYPYDDGLGYIEAGCNCIAHAGDGSAAPSVNRANAKFIVLAVNSHDALTARVAELEAENERMRAEPNSIRQEVIAAWEALPGGYHDLGRVQMWMMDDLYPVIQKFRAALKPEA